MEVSSTDWSLHVIPVSVGVGEIEYDDEEDVDDDFDDDDDDDDEDDDDEEEEVEDDEEDDDDEDDDDDDDDDMVDVECFAALHWRFKSSGWSLPENRKMNRMIILH